MSPQQSAALKTLLRTGTIASLGTLHDGEPYVSMVPFALCGRGPSFVIHVSRLATHTNDMIREPAVSLMVTAAASPDVPPQALARATIQGRAYACPADGPDHAPARAAYLARFPDSAPMFDFADFALFLIAPRSLRFVGGFGNAASLTAERLAQLFADD